MEIKNNKNISFNAFYRNSPPCMRYLAKDFDGNKMKFNKAIEILDKKCSKHKFFDMFYSPDSNSIKIVPKDNAIEKIFPYVGRYMNISASESYKTITTTVYNELKQDTNTSFFKRIISIFSFKKAKKLITIEPYDKLPSNVREAVDIIEKMEHSLLS